MGWGGRGAKGRKKRDNGNSIINKIYLNKSSICFSKYHRKSKKRNLQEKMMKYILTNNRLVS